MGATRSPLLGQVFVGGSGGRGRPAIKIHSSKSQGTAAHAPQGLLAEGLHQLNVRHGRGPVDGHRESLIGAETGQPTGTRRREQTAGQG